mmetsp:Transcript_57324/g.166386  ORF Transcript_57324/g.166386 Transcript_57324/m.166386 type:complete len:295 (-) Transcript_57324:583-1467(-)
MRSLSFFVSVLASSVGASTFAATSTRNVSKRPWVCFSLALRRPPLLFAVLTSASRSFSVWRACSSCSSSSRMVSAATASLPKEATGILRSCWAMAFKEPFIMMLALRCTKARQASASLAIMSVSILPNWVCKADNVTLDCAQASSSCCGARSRGDATMKARGVVPSTMTTRPKPVSSMRVSGFVVDRNLMRSRNDEIALTTSVVQCGFSRKITQDPLAAFGKLDGSTNLITFSCPNTNFSRNSCDCGRLPALVSASTKSVNTRWYLSGNSAALPPSLRRAPITSFRSSKIIAAW